MNAMPDVSKHEDHLVNSKAATVCIIKIQNIFISKIYHIE